MIVVKVELWHASQPGKVTELARMHIANVGGGDTIRDYHCIALRGRNAKDFKKIKVQRMGTVYRHAALSEHVWNLVTKALLSMGYARPKKPG